MKLEKDYAFRFGGDWFEGAYIRDTGCGNCGKKDQMHIKKGLPIPSAYFVCSHCGCKTVKVL